MLKYLAVAAAPLLLATLANAAPVDNIPTGDNFQLRGTARESFVRNGWRLIETSDQAPPSWLPPDQVQQLIYNHRGGFMDVTEDIMELNPAKKPKNLPLIPVTPQQHSLVNALNAHISKDSLRERVTKFSSYPTRFYQSPTGVEAAEWIYSQAAGILANYSRPDAVSVTKFAHSWKQNSVIARIEGTTNAEEIVILGAHLDSINQSPFNKNAPGADDDATGSMTLLELLTIVVAQDYRPTRSVEFHWYSAEEVGLKGSIDIAGSYQRQQKKVAGMLQLDMTGWNKGFIGILTDFTDPELTKLLRKLVDTYTTAARKDFKCSYSCSDHASWNRAGYRSAMSFEADMKNDNIYIHTEKDTVDKLDWEHAANIARVAMGFLIEMSA